MTTGHKIVSNMFYFFLDFLTVTVAGYIFWMLMGKMLAPDQYGILTAVLAIFSVMASVVIVGLTEALPKLVSENKQTSGGIIRYSFKVATALGLFFSILVYFLAEQISLSFYGSVAMAQPIQLLALLLLAANIGSTTKAALQGLQNFKAMFIADLIGNIGRLGAAVIFVMFGFLALGGVIAWVLYFIVLAIICGVFLLRQKMQKGIFDKRAVWKFGGLSAASLLGYYLILQGGVIVLAMLTNAQAVGYFGVAVLFGQILIFVPTVINGALLPSFSELWVGHKDVVKRLLLASLKLAILAVLPFTLLFILASGLLVQVIYSPAYLPATAFFPAYMLGSFLFGLVVLILMALYAIGKPANRLGIVTAGAILNIVLCFMLIPPMGPVGAAFAFLTSQIVMLAAALLVMDKTIPLTFSHRALWTIPAAALFCAILWLNNLTASLLLKVIIVVVALTTYTLTLFAGKTIAQPDLVLFDYVPDIWGLALLKKSVRNLVKKFQ